MVDPVQRAWEMVRTLATEGEVAERMARLSRESSLSPGLMKALLHLHRQAHLSMRGLAGALGCDPSYLTGLVDELHERGLAERQSHPDDRRVKTVVLTPAGIQQAETIMATLSVPPASFRSLNRSEASQLADLLAKVAQATGEERVAV